LYEQANGWLVELTGEGLDAPMFLSISTTKKRFGWTPSPEQALVLARETDAEALAQYACARIPENTTATTRKVEWEREKTDLQRENERLRRRIVDLESILNALRRIRGADVERAVEESQSTVD